VEYSRTRRSHGLWAEEVKRIIAGSWYRQRFDACPHLLFFVADAHINAVWRSPYPFGQKDAWVVFRQDVADWHHNLQELRRTGALFLRSVHKDHGLLARMKRWVKLRQAVFREAGDKVQKVRLQALSDEALLALYDELAAAYTAQLLLSPLIDGFALTTDERVAQGIRAQLARKPASRCQSSLQLFARLTAQTHEGFTQREQRELLATRGRRLALETHRRRFHWWRNNYAQEETVSVAEFAQRYQELKGRSAMPRALPMRVQVRQKEQLLRTLRLPEWLRELVRLTDQFHAWQDRRKESTLIATSIFLRLLREISRRTGYSIDELRYAVPPEMRKIMRRAIPEKELQRRYEGVVFVFRPSAYACSSDRRIVDQFPDQVGAAANGRAKELRGLSGGVGVAAGPVRIVLRASDIDRLKEGDVLVTVMTRPDYFPGMLRACAIVTDEGGLTSHAMSIAREHNKPCVIATKRATSVLKDGDWVQVDAAAGIVRILQK
jgi:phosphohistidine swiveling domain-containing protein